MEIDEVALRPCPACGGMVLMVHVPRGGVVLWCSECERTWNYDAGESGERGLADWWNDGEEA